MLDFKEAILKKSLASFQYSPEKIKNMLDIRNRTKNITADQARIIIKIENWTKSRWGKPGQGTALAPKNPDINSPTKNSLTYKRSLVQDHNNNNVKSKNQMINCEHSLNNNKNRLLPLRLQLSDIGNTKFDQISILAKNPTKNSSIYKTLSGQSRHSPPKKSDQVPSFHNNAKNPESYTGKINSDTYLSLLLNIDYLSADISALYTTDSDSMNNLLNPIKESIKQLESANIRQKLKELEKINSYLTNLPVNIYNLGLKDKLLEETQVTNEKPNEELKNSKFFLKDLSMDPLLDFSKINQIKQSLKQFLLSQDHAVRNDKLENITRWLNELSARPLTTDLIEETLKKLQNPEIITNELLKKLYISLNKSSILTLELMKESKETLLATTDSKVKQNEQEKMRLFIIDHLVKTNISEFINNILEKNTPQIEINEAIYSSINLTIDSFKHILSKIALNLSNANQKTREPLCSPYLVDIDLYKQKQLGYLKTKLTTLMRKMCQLNSSLVQENNSDYFNVMNQLKEYTTGLIKKEEITDSLLNIEKSLDTLDKEKNPKLYLKINQYYFLLKTIKTELERINNFVDFDDYLSSYSMPLSLTSIFWDKINTLTDLLINDHIPFNKEIFGKFGSILINMQALLYERSLSDTNLKNSTAAFLNQLASLITEIYKKKCFLENSDETFFKLISECHHAIIFSKTHLEHILDKEQHSKSICINFSNQYRSLRNRMQLYYSKISNVLPSKSAALTLFNDQIGDLIDLETCKLKRKKGYIQTLIHLNILLGKLEKEVPCIEKNASLFREMFDLRQLLSQHKNLCFRNEKIIYDFEVIEKNLDISLINDVLSNHKFNKIQNISDLTKLNSNKCLKSTLISQCLIVKKAIDNISLINKTEFNNLINKNLNSDMKFNASLVKRFLTFENHSLCELIAFKLNYLRHGKKIIKTLKNNQKINSYPMLLNKVFVKKIIEWEPLFINTTRKKITGTTEESLFNNNFLEIVKNIFDPLYSESLNDSDHFKKMEDHLNQLHRCLASLDTSINMLPDKHFGNKKGKLGHSALEIRASIKDLLPLVILSKIQVSQLLLKHTPNVKPDKSLYLNRSNLFFNSSNKINNDKTDGSVSRKIDLSRRID